MEFSKEFAVSAYNNSILNGMLDGDMICFLFGVSFPGYRNEDFQNSI